jgi:hypothetical protein
VLSLILDDIADLFSELSKNHTHKEIARHFGRERKFVISIKNGCNPTLNAEFVAGLNHYGYELKLVEKE